MTPISPPTAKQKKSNWWLMFRKFLKHGTSIASFAPSSKFLAREILKGIDFDQAKCIVELGAGTGPITVELLKRVKPHTRLLIVEIDPDFCRHLRERFPNAEIVEGDATKLAELLQARGIDMVDEVVSGLPLPSFPPELRKSIIDSSLKVLSPRGHFRQLTVMPLVYWKMYRRYFSDVRFRLVPLNLPPAGVYHCRGEKLILLGNRPEDSTNDNLPLDAEGLAAQSDVDWIDQKYNEGALSKYYGYYIAVANRQILGHHKNLNVLRKQVETETGIAPSRIVTSFIERLDR